MGWKRGQPYGQDLRDRVFLAADGGLSVGGVAQALRVSVSYVSKVLGRRRRTGETTIRPQRCHVAPKLAGYHAAIRERVASYPDATLAELQSWLLESHQVSASITLIWETLKALELTLKKDRACGGAEPSGRCAGPYHLVCRAGFVEPGKAGVH